MRYTRYSPFVPTIAFFVAYISLKMQAKTSDQLPDRQKENNKQKIYQQQHIE